MQNFRKYKIYIVFDNTFDYKVDNSVKGWWTELSMYKTIIASRQVNKRLAWTMKKNLNMNVMLVCG